MKGVFLIAAVLLTAVAAQADTAKPFRVGQGSVTGTYTEAFVELSSACSTESLPLEPLFPDGKGDGANNLEALVNSKAQAAFVRNDVIFWQGQNGQLGNIKTLFTLWPETVHLLALSNSKIVVGKTLGFGGQPKVFNTITDLAGYRLGAVGANQITANVIKSQTQIQFDIIPISDGKAAIAALAAGQVEAVLFAAGKPLPILEKLDATYKLLAIPPDVAHRVDMVYRPATITYSNLAQAFNVPTVEADSVFVTKVFNTESKRQQLAELRSCFLKRLAELQDEGSPRWQNVDANNRGKWPWYELADNTRSVESPRNTQPVQEQQVVIPVRARRR
jgi:TRAP-type uncharacterized transport system substrate-binding protein